MTAVEVLGPLQLEAVRQVVREELQAAARPAAPPPPELLTPREASERLRGRPSEATIREWIHAGRLLKRTNNLDPNPRRPNFLVQLDEVVAAMAQAGAAPEPPPPADLEAARARARAKAAQTARRGKDRR